MRHLPSQRSGTNWPGQRRGPRTSLTSLDIGANLVNLVNLGNLVNLDVLVAGAIDHGQWGHSCRLGPFWSMSLVWP